MLVGSHAAKWTDDFTMVEGSVSAVAPGGVVQGYIITWADGSEHGSEVTMSVDDTRAVCKLGRWVKADREATTQKADRRHYLTKWKHDKRAEKRAEAEAATGEEEEEGDAGDGDEGGGQGGFGDDHEFSDDELKWLHRSINRANLFAPSWWASLGKNGIALHSHLFGFDTPGQMRRFYRLVFAPHYGGEERIYGLGPCELMALALLKMRTDRPWIEIEADMGASRGHGHLTARIVPWIHRLGAFAKKSLVGVPDVAYMDECIPQVYRDCNMADVMEVGDGTVFMTETPRRGIWKQLKNQLYNEKTGRSGMLGESLCTPHGMNSMAADLFTGRTSEVNALKDMIELFKQVRARPPAPTARVC